MSVFQNDPELLRTFREGKRDALERVYRTYVRGVDRYIRAQAVAAGHPEMAQASAVADVVQDVFIRAFSVASRDAYDGARDFGPYLTRIARNCFVDALRRQGRETLKQPDELARIVADAPVEVDGAIAPEVLTVLRDYVAGLPPALAGVYEQRFVLERSQVEASAALDLSRRGLRTAEAHLRRGVRKALQRAGISLRNLEPPPADISTRIVAHSVSSRSRA